MLRKIRSEFFLNPSRIYLETFLRKAASAAAPKAAVLDAGAGDGRYKDLFTHTNYQATDFCQVDKPYVMGKLDYIADLKFLAAADSTYDLIVCSQVLEHINEPQQALSELYRVLKPGGQLWLSAPLFYEEHEKPHDYYRYTQFGLRYLLEKTGFSVISIERLEGYYGTLAYQNLAAARALPVTPKPTLLGLLTAPALLLLKVSFAFLASMFAYLELYQKEVQIGYCKNYTVVAKKP